ncbi:MULTISPECIES: hypothetical protein [Serratia]|uniref:hypothetical protein n=1 Tax=Serratia TaxID=613 RepID=UPI0018D3FA37|nr:hypothetical protein [Serratia marcescens]MBH2675350.1 hypothetical protein [Serratia marcescens]
MQIIITIEEKPEGIDVNIKANDFCTKREAQEAERIRAAIVRELSQSEGFQMNDSTFKTSTIVKGNKNVH